MMRWWKIEESRIRHDFISWQNRLNGSNGIFLFPFPMRDRQCCVHDTQKQRHCHSGRKGRGVLLEDSQDFCIIEPLATAPAVPQSLCGENNGLLRDSASLVTSSQNENSDRGYTQHLSLSAPLTLIITHPPHCHHSTYQQSRITSLWRNIPTLEAIGVLQWKQQQLSSGSVS